MGLAMTNMELSCPAFSNGGKIPSRYTDDGENLSPPFEWTRVPAGTDSLALFCHDPDAPLVKGSAYGFVHWVVYNLPAEAAELPEGAASYTFGRNDYGRRSYDGPRPPEGHGTHRYYFWLLALESGPDLDAGLSLWGLLPRVESGVLGMSRVVGIYER